VKGGGGVVEYVIASDADMTVVRDLFREYGDSLGIDLAFQDFEAELASLPGKYAPPEGAVIVARNEGAPCGCVALRPIEAGVCEMKRLYVRPDTRGLGVGAELVKRVIALAKSRGYTSMRLDTLPSMKSAVSLYKLAGFREIAPYIFNPIPGALFLEKIL
jgi:ribosomal protein S18 acetylase RimI-like enzyme